MASRSFFWLSAALLLVLVLGWQLKRALIRLKRITAAAYTMNVARKGVTDLSSEVGRQDELGTLARTIQILFERGQVKTAFLRIQAAKDAAERQKEIELAEGQARSKQRILDVIGHEIGSPLETLFSKTNETSDLFPILERIRRAVDTLRVASSYQAGVESSTVLRKADLAAYIAKYCENVNSTARDVQARGVGGSVLVRFDAIHLEVVLDNLVKNAVAFRVSGSSIDMELQITSEKVVLTVQNEGPPIPQEFLLEIFEFGYTSQIQLENRGIGLYVCKMNMEAMGGTIEAENRENGPAFILAFPRTDI